MVEAPRDRVFEWHARPGAFERLGPPWEDMRILKRTRSLQNGEQLHFQVRMGPIWEGWLAEHFGYEPPNVFCDRQLSGPFASWEHRHLFEDTPSGTRILDRIEYQLPLDPLSRLAPRFLVEEKIESMFRYRRSVVKEDIERHERAGLGSLRVALTGASGLVGGALVPFLTTGGHQVTPLVRGKGEGIRWSPTEGIAATEREKLEGTDAVVHLAGESVLGLWTDEKKARIRDSRTIGTRKLCESLAQLRTKPRVLVCASAVGFYGSNRGNEVLTEGSSVGSGFLADVAREWEEATAAARDAGIRVVNLRVGIVLSPRGGALRTMLPAFKLGVGGRLGDGAHWMSWIALDDLVYLIHHAIATEAVSGPLNATAPTPATNAELTAKLARVLGRWVGPPAPSFLLRAVVPEMAEQVFLSSLRVLPEKALATGFHFAYPDLEQALRHLLGK